MVNITRRGAFTRFVYLLLAVSVLMASGQVLAACSTVNQYTVQVPLRVNTLSAGQEFPVGSVIMRQRVIGFTMVTATCTGAGNVAPQFRLVGGTLYPGYTDTYQTGISGLGVRVWQPFDNRYYPYTKAPIASPLNFNQEGYLSFDLDFVKLGPVTGGTINTSLFPQVQVNATDSASNVRVAWHTITGSAVIQTPSCTTPNFSWDLGTSNATILKNIGDASPWVDAPVTLTGCSAFLGNNRNGTYTRYNITGWNSGNVTQPGLAPNKLTMTLTPATTVIDSANGIVAPDSASSASGFGVQVASRQSGTYVPWNLSGSMEVTPIVGDSSGTVSFPLGARMIRTSNSVQTGKISTSLTYTINYE